jgi:hypothetical protein
MAPAKWATGHHDEIKKRDRTCSIGWVCHLAAAGRQ